LPDGDPAPAKSSRLASTRRLIGPWAGLVAVSSSGGVFSRYIQSLAVAVSVVVPTQIARHANLARILHWLEARQVVGWSEQALYLGNATTAHRLEVMAAGSEIGVLFARHLEVVLHLPRGWMDDPDADPACLPAMGSPSFNALQEEFDATPAYRESPPGAGEHPAQGTAAG